MTYFRLKTVDLCWLEMEIPKGTLFIKGSIDELTTWTPCDEYRDRGFSYDRLTPREVLLMINKNGNVYWRN